LQKTSILLIRSLDSISGSRNIKNLKSLDAISGRLVIFVINSRARQTETHRINGVIVTNS
jgi:hypothetical protein